MMRALVVALALAVGAALGWYARGLLGPEPAGGATAAAAPEGGGPAAAGDAAPAPAAQPAPVATSAGVPAAAAPRAPVETVPTAADSAAAVAEDVSPEWKMRTRQMEPFAGCMEKTRNAPPSVRPTLVAACHRLPDAPARAQ